MLTAPSFVALVAAVAVGCAVGAAAERLAWCWRPVPVAGLAPVAPSATASRPDGSTSLGRRLSAVAWLPVLTWGWRAGFRLDARGRLGVRLASEATLAVVALALVAVESGPTVRVAIRLLTVGLLVIIADIDARYRLIPRLAVATVAVLALADAALDSPAAAVRAATWGLLLGLPVATTWAFYRWRQIPFGLGDVWLVAATATLLEAAVLIPLVVSTGATVVIGLWTRQRVVPKAPAMVAATIAVLIARWLIEGGRQ